MGSTPRIPIKFALLLSLKNSPILMGFPIREIVLATNANQVIPDFLHSGLYEPRPSISTLANAMDVGNPSNFERLQTLYPTFALFKSNVNAFSVSDEEIQNTIKAVYTQHQKIICPHTATGCFVRQKLSAEPWIIAATADPSKFNTVIEPLLDVTIPTPHQLQKLLAKPVHILEVEKVLKE
ncbi:Pyridoxal phosphate-dependent enzyme, beta subunit [Legionella fallonii LLAP-10]|uniref:Pyridoxal phosphate-dependent enzyme, beta subunit n=2 Tax=Legionella fallonii TaxID=96230 RepID=A0A098G408_9GAMM|nr:Pyridoxal phosphate-dependent enzyme, beta subunit [Legionella fallonii LLAP-10]